MYDPKFEKAVQQKMEELEFRPAESVWANIEKAVADRRHRRSFFFWRFMLPGLFLITAAGVWYFEAKPAKQVLAASPAANTPQTQASSVNASPATATNTPATAADPANKTVSTSAAGQIAAAGKWETSSHSDRGATSNSGRGATSSRGWKTTGRRDREITSQGDRKLTGAGMQETTSAADREMTGAADQEPASAAPLAFANGSTSDALTKDRQTWLYQPELARQSFAAAIRANALTTKKATNSIGLTQTKRPWEAGFVAGGGISRLNRLDADKVNAAVAYTASSFYAINRSAVNKNFITDVRPDASFSGGIYLQKALSSRWIFNTGMNLHYYSTRITTGQQVSTYVQQSVSLIVPNAFASASTAQIYSSGDMQVHTNRFYFLELPASIQWKLSQSRVLPVFLEGGVSLTRLMGADALFYNAKSGIYSKDENIVNKTQFNISSALMIGLPIHGIHIQVGPQIQYGLTPLVNNQSLGDQHFFYTGIRLVVLPGKR